MRIRHKQFTLIELLIVMTIGAILMGLASQKFMKQPAGLRRREAINQLKVSFSNARMLALATGVTTTLGISEDGTLLEVKNKEAKVNPFLVSQRMRDQLEDSDVVQKRERIVVKPIKFKLPNGCKITTMDDDSFTEETKTKPLFKFYPDGEATGEAAKLITGTQVLIIEVDRLTSKLTIIQEEK